MIRKTYIVQRPGVMNWEAKKLTKKEAENLRAAGYIVEK